VSRWSLHLSLTHRSAADQSAQFYAQDGNFIRQRRRRHALLQPSRISTKISTSLSALMSVEADTGLCHLTRLMKITARATENIRFLNGRTAVVTILHRFQDRPFTQRLKIVHILYRSSIEALLG